MQQLQEALSAQERFKDLMKRKKKLLAKIRRNKKEAVKARIEKAKINEELRQIKGKHNLFADMDPEKARETVKSRIEAVNPSEIYPRDLERHFDSIDKPKAKSEQHKTLDLGKVSETPIITKPRDEDDHIVGDDNEEYDRTYIEDEVMDLSDQ
jgi:hypothetical protein